MSRERVILEIDDKIVKSAVNQREVEIELNFDLDDPDAQGTVSINNWDFEGVTDGTGAFLINKQFDDGINGGIGCGEGIGFKYSVQDDNGKLTVLDAYLDLGDPEALFECGRIKTPSKIRGGVDWLNDSADCVEYNILFANGRITSDDYVQVPYIISSIPNNQDIAMLTISGFVIGIELIRAVKDLSDLITEVAGFFTTLPALVKLLFFAIYIAVLIIALFKLIKDLVRAIIQPTKFHTGMKLITLLEKGAEHLGMTFYSSIFENDEDWKNVVILPSKFRSFRDPSDEKFFGSTRPRTDNVGYFEGSFGTLLREMKTFFNAKIAVKDNVISLERVDFNPSTANYKLPPVDQKIFSHNFHEWRSTYNIKFLTDLSETNTIDTYEGTVTNVVPQPLVIKNIDMTLYGGSIRRNDIQFARGIRKTELTAPEKFFNIILKAIGPSINGITSDAPSVVRKQIPSTGLVDLFGNRIGMLSLSNDYFMTNKIIMYEFGNSAVENKVSENNAVKINTSFLYDNFHFVNSGTPTQDRPNGNQWKRFPEVTVGFCKEDYDLIKNNNLIFDTNGKVAKLETLKWNPHRKTARILYRLNEFFLGTKELKDTPDGEG